MISQLDWCRESSVSDPSPNGGLRDRHDAGRKLGQPQILGKRCSMPANVVVTRWSRQRGPVGLSEVGLNALFLQHVLDTFEKNGLCDSP